MTKTLSPIAERLKLLRKKLGYSQRIFAEKLNYSVHSLNSIEAGKQKTISLDLSEKLRNLGINPDWLLAGEGEMYSKPVYSSVYDSFDVLIKNNDLNKTTNLLDNNNCSLDNIKNNACSDLDQFEGKILMSVDDKLASVYHRLGLIEGELRAEIKYLKERNDKLEKELIELKYNK